MSAIVEVKAFAAIKLVFSSDMHSTFCDESAQESNVGLWCASDEGLLACR